MFNILEVEKRMNEVTRYSKEYFDLSICINLYRDIQIIDKEIDDLNQSLKDENDAEMLELIREEVIRLEMDRQVKINQYNDIMSPKKQLDYSDRNVIFELRSGEGGEEAGIFTDELLKMYTRYSVKQGWQVEILSIHYMNKKSIREVVLSIKGKNVFSRLKYESGVHRVQRVSVTDSRNRIHTSTASIAVLPEMDAVDIHLDMDDVQIDICKSSGPGGQGVNTSDTAVKMTHLPTGIQVDMQAERSQLQNRIRAKEVLIARLYEYEQNKIKQKYDSNRKDMIGSNKRVEKIRTYNYPQNRLTDHRIDHSIYNLDVALDGNLDNFIDAVIEKLSLNND